LAAISHAKTSLELHFDIPKAFNELIDSDFFRGSSIPTPLRPLCCTCLVQLLLRQCLPVKFVLHNWSQHQWLSLWLRDTFHSHHLAIANTSAKEEKARTDSAYHSEILWWIRQLFFLGRQPVLSPVCELISARAPISRAFGYLVAVLLPIPLIEIWVVEWSGCRHDHDVSRSYKTWSINFEHPVDPGM
jgi:hypothetical protein